jgi:hypothetical protein
MYKMEYKLRKYCINICTGLGLLFVIGFSSFSQEEPHIPNLAARDKIIIAETVHLRGSPLSGQKTGSFKVHSVPALNDFIFSI